MAFIFNSSQNPFRAKTNKIWQKSRSKKSTDVFAKLYMLKAEIPGKVTAHQIQSKTTENIHAKIAQFVPNFDSMQRVLRVSRRIHSAHEAIQNHSINSHPWHTIAAPRDSICHKARSTSRSSPRFSIRLRPRTLAREKFLSPPLLHFVRRFL